MNSALLKGEIRAKSMTQEDIASKIGISLSRFNAKLNNTGGAEFSLGEVRAIKALLCLNSEAVDSIFFDEKVALPTLWWIVLNQSSFYCSQNVLKRRPVVFDNAFTPMCHVVKICFRGFDFSSR